MADNVKPVNVINPDGELVSLPANQVTEALRSGGYKPATAGDIKEFRQKEEYGEGIKGPALATAAGAARSATFGLSDELLTKSGAVKPETLENLKKYNPNLTTAGEIGGVVGSVLLGPEVAPAGLLSKGAGAITKSVLPGAERAVGLLVNPETSPVIHRIVSQAAAAGAGSAVEGAAYGLGQSVSEHALGDPTLNSQKVITNIGMGALFGGVLGSTLKAGEIAVPEAVGAAKSAFDKLASVGANEEGVGLLGRTYAKASSFVSGKPEQDILDAWANRKMALRDPHEIEHLSDQFTKTITETHDAVEKAARDAFKDVRPQEAAKYLETADAGVAKQQFDDAFAKIKETTDLMKFEPDLYPARYARKLEQISERIAKDITNESSAADIFQALDDLKGSLDKDIKYGKIPSAADADAQNVIKGLRGSIKENLENEEIWGKAATRQAAFNDAYNEYVTNLTGKNAFRSKFMTQAPSRSGKVEWQIDPVKVKTYFNQIGTDKGDVRADLLANYLRTSKNLLDEVEKSYQALPERTFSRKDYDTLFGQAEKINDESLRQAAFNKQINSLGGGGHNTYLGEGAAAFAALHHPVLGAAIEGYNVLRNSGLTIQRLAKIERAIQQTNRAMGYLTKNIFKAGTKVGQKYAGYVGGTASSLYDKEKHDKIMDRIVEYTNDPEKLTNHLDAMAKPVIESAPDMGTNIQQTAAVGINFLRSKLPQGPDPKPLSKPYVPSQQEIAQFKKYYDAVENPLSALEQIKTGMLSKETLETLNTVYPQLYDSMKENVTEELASHLGKKRDIDYQTKLMLGAFLGMDLDNSMTQQAIMTNQGAFAKLGAQNAMNNPDQLMKQKSTQTGLSKLGESGRLLTASQSANMRANKS